MQTEEIVFDVTSESHNLEFNKSGGYHAYPKHNRKDFYFLKSNQDLIKQGISMDIFHVKLELTESDILKYFKNKVKVENNTGGSHIDILSTRIVTDIHFMNFDTNEWEKMDIRSVSNLSYNKGYGGFMVSIFFRNKIDNQRFINKNNLNLKIKVTCLPPITKSDLENMEK